MTADRDIDRIRRGTVQILQEDELAERLAEGRPLRVKLGVDPTAPDIHLGHVVVLGKLRQFQDLGHTAVLIIGDFTARIGDPSGRSATRPRLSPAEIERAASTYREQVFHVLDPARTELRYNSEWLGRLDLGDVIRLCGTITLARMLERDDFARRLAANAPIGLHELLYPLLQAYDSVEVRADVELGGTDQVFNILLGRQLQKDAGQRPQVGVILPLLEGTDGVQKMSKSLGNYIGVTEPPAEIFGKIMSLSDPLMLRYYELLTDEDVEGLRTAIEAGRLHPMEAKKRLAEMLVGRFHGAAEARRARRSFERRFQQRTVDREELPVVRARRAPEVWLPGLLRDAGLVASSSEARRLLRQRAVRLDGSTVCSESVPVARGAKETLIEVGKRRAARVRWVDGEGEGAA